MVKREVSEIEVHLSPTAVPAKGSLLLIISASAQDVKDPQQTQVSKVLIYLRKQNFQELVKDKDKHVYSENT